MSARVRSSAGKRRRAGEAAERSGPCPECVLMEYRFGLGRSAPRDRWTRAFGSRIFNPLRWRPPAGGRLANPPDRTGDFSPRLVRFRLSAPRDAAVRSGAPEAPSEDPHAPPTDPSGPLDTGRRTLPARPPPPPVRSPAGRPPLRWGDCDYAGGLEGEASISRTPAGPGRKALISRGAAGLDPRRETGVKVSGAEPGRILVRVIALKSRA